MNRRDVIRAEIDRLLATDAITIDGGGRFRFGDKGLFHFVSQLGISRQRVFQIALTVLRKRAPILVAKRAFARLLPPVRSTRQRVLVRSVRQYASQIGCTEAQYRERVALGFKWCGDCKAWQLKGCFGKDKSRSDGLYPVCKAANCRRVAEWKSKHR